MNSFVAFEPLTLANWKHLEHLFGKWGDCGGCWCMTWRMSCIDYERSKGEGNKQKLLRMVEEGKPLSILAFQDGAPIGGCSVSPRETLVRLENSRFFLRIDDLPVWSIVSLYFKREFRRRNFPHH